ncbi:hybrid sensor histidine kinase/response regulator [Burkholderia stagnalis]|uniref:histidine kinase n=1 Tax=Burkholderia stagnalis TaxID=1503054 RepID=A0ABX9YF04_9BURK|nr:hybrid sensor histidine kinase/response regulator [Burkholderia stagnalis]RQQ47142.1 hybrid sensor histidine kinase/response regulator [Burkholderia stagnalis]RQQ59025.1 hybrid sensor histidine kinase/response regulator [Burkholderia stagnalis]RQQ59306.1 hybrid sensor histidine kinase/response regulator [Burkholderia stagnalis]RQQ73359.1 hybrid sensor histidine kinase/response regulator [Burkholderia stagnalis]RQQ79508.1 hybrid sensor histidine kinase/response regulator [Burkholderia stagna
MSVDDDLARTPLLDLFREEAQTQAQALASGLLTLEHAPADAAALEACMRAAHSLKGAARIIDLPDGVDVAHAMEECFVAAQRGMLTLTPAHIDELLRGVDLLLRVGETDPATAVARADIDALLARLSAPEPAAAAAAHPVPEAPAVAPEPEPEPEPAPPRAPAPPPAHAHADAHADARADAHADTPPAAPSASPPEARHDPQRMLRVRAEQLDRLLSLSGESLVESHWLKPFTGSILRIKRMQRDVSRALDVLVETLAERVDPAALAALNDVRQGLGNLQLQLGARIDELDRFDRRSTHLAQQLYDEALRCRMRPFGDAAHAYPRIVRDLARSLGKRVQFSIVGESTQVDRDILDMLDAPLGHLLRNALDHGVEAPEQRVAAGKPADARVTLEARHSAGQLQISVSDDGAGIDLDALRTAVVRRRLADADTAARLSDHELLDFLLLPGFSMRERVTDVSGRGVGLDAVHDMVKAVRGTVRIFTEPGRGARFVLQLPLTLSIVRSLLVEVGGEAYAIPLAHVRRTLELARADIDMLEGQQHFRFDGRAVGLVTAHQLLGTRTPDEARDSVATVVIGDESETYGIAVDRFLGECMLVIQPLDRRLGKVKDIAAAALMDNGEPVLIIDVEDLLRSVDKLVRGGQLDRVQRTQRAAAARSRHVLVVDDSLTVRELERKLLEKRGYAVTVAVDGMDGWNALRGGEFDLVVTDIDMPRMDGIELVTLIKRDAVLKALPVMIVSYKDREEDRRRGLDAGADYYLAKSSFHDETLLDAVRDLIGEARP